MDAELRRTACGQGDHRGTGIDEEVDMPSVDATVGVKVPEPVRYQHDAARARRLARGDGRRRCRDRRRRLPQDELVRRARGKNRHGNNADGEDEQGWHDPIRLRRRSKSP